MTDKINDLKHQLQQLDALRASGALGAEAAASARAELERKLVDAVLAMPTPGPSNATASSSAAPFQPTPAAPRPSRSLVLGLAVFVLVFGAAGYLWRGSPAGWDASPTTGPNTAGAVAEAPEAAASAQHSMAMGQDRGHDRQAGRAPESPATTMPRAG